jgi:hypothetical protein
MLEIDGFGAWLLAWSSAYLVYTGMLERRDNRRGDTSDPMSRESIDAARASADDSWEYDNLSLTVSLHDFPTS